MTDPSSIVNLANWKVTLPTGKKGSPTEVTQPRLNTFSDSNFYVDGANVIFTASTGGVTTSGSSYPRSELREMKAGGKKPASWSNKRMTRTMDVTEAFLELPSGKPEVVGAQIHGGADDITKLILRGSTLSITIGRLLHASEPHEWQRQGPGGYLVPDARRCRTRRAAASRRRGHAAPSRTTRPRLPLRLTERLTCHRSPTS